MGKIIIALDKDELEAQLTDIFIKPILKGLKQSIDRVIKDAIAEEKLSSFDEWIKTDQLAGRMVGLGASTMKMRRKNGFYREGIDYKKENNRILWRKKSLLNEEKIDRKEAK